MRRIRLREGELDRVIELRRKGLKWVQVERETGLSRRRAKRAFDNWQKTQSSEELRDARQQVAAEEFRAHLESLISLARNLVNYMPEAVPFDETKEADDLLEKLWERNMQERDELATAFSGKPGKEQRRIIRENQMLFESLRGHTKGEVRWQAFEEWKEAWNACIKELPGLRSKARELVENILDDQRARLMQKIQSSGRRKNEVVDQMAEGVVEAVWHGILAGERDQGHTYIRILLREDRAPLVAFRPNASTAYVELTDRDTAEGVRAVCMQAAQILGRENRARRAAEAVNTLRASTREIEAMLDPLVLRPLILRSRCSLCPV